MCLAPGAAVPLPPAGLLVGDGAPLVAEVLDDRATRMVCAVPAGDAPSAVLVLPDGRGLTRSYETLVELLARCGIPAGAVDLHGPVAGPDPRPDDLVQQFSRQVQWPVLRRAVADAARTLRVRSGARRLVVLGFCLGGRVALLAAADPQVGAAEILALYPDPVGQARGDV